MKRYKSKKPRKKRKTRKKRGGNGSDSEESNDEVEEWLTEFKTLLTTKKNNNIFFPVHCMTQYITDFEREKLERKERQPLKISFIIPNNVYIVLFNKENCLSRGDYDGDKRMKKHLNQKWWENDEKKWSGKAQDGWRQTQKYNFAILKKYAKLYTPGDEMYNYHVGIMFKDEHYTQFNVSTGKEIDSYFTVKSLQKHAKNRTGPFPLDRFPIMTPEEIKEADIPKQPPLEGLEHIPLEDIILERVEANKGKSYILFLSTCDALGHPESGSRVDYGMGKEHSSESLQEDRRVWDLKVDLHRNLSTQGRGRFRFAFERLFNMDVTQFPEINREVYERLEDLGQDKGYYGPFVKTGDEYKDYPKHVSAYIINDNGKPIYLCASDCTYPYGLCGDHINGLLSRCKLTHRKCEDSHTGKLEKCKLIPEEEMPKSKVVGGKRRKRRTRKKRGSNGKKKKLTWEKKTCNKEDDCNALKGEKCKWERGEETGHCMRTIIKDGKDELEPIVAVEEIISNKLHYSDEREKRRRKKEWQEWQKRKVNLNHVGPSGWHYDFENEVYVNINNAGEYIGEQKEDPSNTPFRRMAQSAKRKLSRVKSRFKTGKGKRTCRKRRKKTRKR